MIIYIKACCCCCVWAQSCPALCDPMDCSPPGPSVHEFSRQEYWSGLPFPSPRDLPDPGIEPGSPTLAGGFFTTVPPDQGSHLGSLHWDLSILVTAPPVKSFNIDFQYISLFFCLILVYIYFNSFILQCIYFIVLVCIIPHYFSFLNDLIIPSILSNILCLLVSFQIFSLIICVYCYISLQFKKSYFSDSKSILYFYC